VVEDLTDRQRDVLETALEIIRREGMQKLTFRRIAQQLDVTEPAIYRHFESKSELVETLYYFTHSKLKELTAPVLNPELSADEALRKLLKILLEHMEQVDAVYLTLLGNCVIQKNDHWRELMADALELLRSRFEEIIQAGIEAGTFRSDLNLQTSATAVMGLIQSRCIYYRLNPEGPRPSEALEEVFSLILKGLAEDPSTIQDYDAEVL